MEIQSEVEASIQPQRLSGLSVSVTPSTTQNQFHVEYKYFTPAQIFLVVIWCGSSILS